MHKSMIQVKVRRPLQFVIILGLLYHVHACMHADKTLNLPISDHKSIELYKSSTYTDYCTCVLTDDLSNNSTDILEYDLHH